MDPKNADEENKRKKMFIDTERKKDEFYQKYAFKLSKKEAENYSHKLRSEDEIASIYEERYKYRKPKELQTEGVVVNSKSILSKNNQLPQKPIIAPPKQQNITTNNITPQINLNMGGITINNEIDKQ